MAKSKIELLLRGLVVLSAIEGDPGGKVGVPATFPFEHELTLRITKVPPQGPSPEPIILTRKDIKKQLSLEIENGTPDKITFADKNAVVRKKPAQNPKSFRWFVNLENQELYGHPLTVDPDAFSTILTFNGGKLFTADKPNESLLQIMRGLGADLETFGRVALKIGIDFDSATRVVFSNDGQPIFNSANEPGTNYKIELTHDAKVHLPVVTDANYYYSAIGLDIPVSDRIFFLSSNLIQLLSKDLKQVTRVKDNRFAEILNATIEGLIREEKPPAGPEAACFPAYLGSTRF